MDVSSKKIIFNEELTLSEFYDSKKESAYDLISYIQKNVGSVYNNKRELLRYFSVFQLLIALDQASENDNCAPYDKYLETAKEYVTKLNQAIKKNYQTDDIQDMQDLKYILSKKPLYLELFFHVQVFDYNKKRPCSNKRSKSLLSATNVFIMNWIMSKFVFIMIMLSYGIPLKGVLLTEEIYPSIVLYLLSKKLLML